MKTGFSDLDELINIQPGELWLLVGVGYGATPTATTGQGGKTTLATAIARNVAERNGQVIYRAENPPSGLGLQPDSTSTSLEQIAAGRAWALSDGLLVLDPAEPFVEPKGKDAARLGAFAVTYNCAVLALVRSLRGSGVPSMAWAQAATGVLVIRSAERGLTVVDIEKNAEGEKHEGIVLSLG